MIVIIIIINDVDVVEWGRILTYLYGFVKGFWDINGCYQGINSHEARKCLNYMLS